MAIFKAGFEGAKRNLRKILSPFFEFLDLNFLCIGGKNMKS